MALVSRLHGCTVLRAWPGLALMWEMSALIPGLCVSNKQWRRASYFTGGLLGLCTGSITPGFQADLSNLPFWNRSALVWDLRHTSTETQCRSTDLQLTWMGLLNALHLSSALKVQWIHSLNWWCSKRKACILKWATCPCSVQFSILDLIQLVI